MRYKTIKSLPGHMIGEIYDDNFQGMIDFAGKKLFAVDYPDWFEPVGGLSKSEFSFPLLEKPYQKWTQNDAGSFDFTGYRSIEEAVRDYNNVGGCITKLVTWKTTIEDISESS